MLTNTSNIMQMINNRLARIIDMRRHGKMADGRHGLDGKARPVDDFMPRE